MSLLDEVEMFLDGFCVCGKLFAASVSHETCCRREIPNDVTEKNFMKEADDMFQVYCKCGFYVVRFHCGKPFEATVDEWRVKQDPIVTANYCNARDNIPRAERNNRTIQEQTTSSYY